MDPSAPYPSEDRMREVFNLVADHVERRYGIPITVSDVTDPYTGDLDGAEIKVDYANEIENALFILVHSFWRQGCPLLSPLAIPDFTPKSWTGRWSGVVV